MTIWDLLRSLSRDRTWKSVLLCKCCWVSSFPSQCVLLPWGPFHSCPTCRRADAHNAAGCVAYAMKWLCLPNRRYSKAEDARGEPRLLQMPHRSSSTKLGSVPGTAI